jgi:Rne/Rng family ribonuclease
MRAEPGSAIRALRDLGAHGIEKIIADDADALGRVRDFCETGMPALLPCLQAHKGKKGLFESFDTEEQIERALSPVVDLPGGGSLIISQTPALTAIDVNSGGTDGSSKEQTAIDVDVEAAVEIAREIRLRNISGQIVVDFVPVRDSGHKQSVLDALINAVAADPQGPHVVGYTRLGLVEMTRRRRGLSLLEIFAGSLTPALAALRGALRQGQGAAAKGLVLKVSPAVCDALKGPAAAALKEAEEKLGLAIKTVPDKTFADGEYDVVCE